MKIHKKTTLGQDATIVGIHEKFMYGFIMDTDRGPDVILHMRWDISGKAHGVTGKPMPCVNWDLITSERVQYSEIVRVLGGTTNA